jgi:hypothetical protein
MKEKIYLQRKNTNMRKIVFLPILFLIVGSSFAQIPWDKCYYERIYIPRAIIKETIELNIIGDPPTQPTPTDDSYRNIYFIHGLGGNASAWTKVAEACWNKSLNIPDFPARKCHTHQLEYVNFTKGTVYAAANDIGQQIRSKAIEYKDHYNINPDRGIIIAHSQGGIVSRALMHLDFVSNTGALPDIGKGYGGVVFVASPVNGAMILNNRTLLRNMANDACNSLLAGPTSSILASFMMKNIFGNLGTTCNTFSGDVLDLFVSQYYDEITASYTVGLEGSLIETFNKGNSNADLCNLPKISIVSYITGNNILWRTANWLVNDPNDEPHFGANDEWKFYNEVVEPAYDDYRAKVQEFTDKYDQCRGGFIGSIIGGIFSGRAIIGAGGIAASVLMGNQYLDRKNAYQKGLNWLDQANEQWNVVIGADYHDTPNAGWVRKQSDGIVLSEAQTYFPCLTAWWGEYGSHMQIRNNGTKGETNGGWAGGIKYGLEYIFSGKHRDPNISGFFYTPTK